MGKLRIEFVGAAGAARTLAGLVADAASAASPAAADGGRVVLVRRARLELVVRAASPAAAAVEAGRTLEETLRGALRHPLPDGDVRVFPSTTEYVAHFVEELAAGRAVDVWYFGPLLPFRGGELGDTLARLARAEPDAWPEVLRLLRLRGLLGPLLARLAGPAREVLRGVPSAPGRPLGHDEGWPLFLAAWDAARAALGAGSEGRSAGLPVPRARDPLPESPEDVFRLYLDTHPAAPASWAAPAGLGACVAAMVGWLLRRANAPADVAAGEAALAWHPWIDPAAAARVLHARGPAGRAPAPAPPPWTEAGGGADCPPAPGGVPDPLPRAGRFGAMNRTRALRFLRAARFLAAPPGPRTAGHAAPGPGDDPFLELENEVWAVDATAAQLAARGVAPSTGQVLALLAETGAGSGPAPLPDRTAATADMPAARGMARASGAAEAGREPAVQKGEDPEVGAAPAPRPAMPLAVLASAARHLDDGERRELAGALAARARSRPLALETGAAGAFFLIRPLLDLGVPGLVMRAGLPPAVLRALVHDATARAADAPPGDRVAEVVARGGLGGEWDPRSPSAARDQGLDELASSLRTHAARLGLDLVEAGDEPGALLLEAACRQLVRWMHGFESSSVAFVLKQVVRRPGAFRVPPDGPVEVAWPASGLDVLLERAGYLEPLPAVPWWDGRGVRWEQ